MHFTRSETSVLESFRLDGSTALVTGAARGLGQAAALALAEAGADVAVLGHAHNPQETQHQIEELGRRCMAFQGDLHQADFRSRLVKDVYERWGHIDILVNNAGTIARSPALDFPEAEWDRVLDLNLTTVFRMCQLVGRKMIEQKHGKIINLASLLSFSGGSRSRPTPPAREAWPRLPRRWPTSGPASM